jgi:hypothetical protein
MQPRFRRWIRGRYGRLGDDDPCSIYHRRIQSGTGSRFEVRQRVMVAELRRPPSGQAGPRVRDGGDSCAERDVLAFQANRPAAAVEPFGGDSRFAELGYAIVAVA